MRLLIPVLLCVAMITPCLRADDDEEAARRRALALLRLFATNEPDVAASHQPACIPDVPAARAKATAESRPLLIWVGGCESVDKAVRGAFPDAVHCHCDSFNGSDEHRLLIPLREGVYAVFDSSKLTVASIPDIRHILEREQPKVAGNVMQVVPTQSSGRPIYLQSARYAASSPRAIAANC